MTNILSPTKHVCKAESKMMIEDPTHFPHSNRISTEKEEMNKMNDAWQAKRKWKAPLVYLIKRVGFRQ